LGNYKGGWVTQVDFRGFQRFKEFLGFNDGYRDTEGIVRIPRGFQKKLYEVSEVSYSSEILSFPFSYDSSYDSHDPSHMICT